MYGIYNGLNPSNYFSCRNGLIEVLFLIEESQISNSLVRILIQFSTRRALGKCFAKNTAKVQKSEPQGRCCVFCCKRENRRDWR